MTRLSCDGAGLFGAVQAAIARLETHVEDVNDLNVFPVPDGDTGSNMIATCREMLAEAERVADDSADRVSAALAFGALMGARGNSGVILSQIVRGLAEGLAGKRHFNGLDVAHAMTLARTTAYGAVTRPVEGTILTVMREAADAAVATAERDNDIEAVLVAATEAAADALRRTPMLNPALVRLETGERVVDSGGAGLVFLLQGALAFARGEVEAPAGPRPRPVPSPTPARVSAVTEELFGYETVYLLEPRPGELLDVDAIRAYLARSGDSVNVAGDARGVKIHIHSPRPDLVLRYGLRLGRLSRINVENLDLQSHDVREARAQAFMVGAQGEVASGPPPAFAHLAMPAVPTAAGSDPGNGAGPAQAGANGRRLPLAIVAVAAGEGIAAALRAFAVDGELGVSIVVGGQAANPSTGELLAAISEAPGEQVIILPNNPNVRLAAMQAAEMADRPVRVVPTRNAAEGIAALLALDAPHHGIANVEPMTAASRAIQTLQVTDAIRDASIEGTKVRKGQSIVLDPDDGLVAVDGDAVHSVARALETLAPGYELVTLWYGDGADLDEAERVARRITQARPELEVEVRHGGQPHYRYLVAAE
ncbi:MAG: DAK2 domain-containing protein [Chloroflexi bacterium]|nr:DAK2 domain-containing protein [Chloroflexota bacterium]